MTDYNYEYLDMEYIHDMADGDDDFLVHIIGVYLRTIPDDVQKLVEVSEQKDIAQVVFYAHKLKGSFNFIGCHKMTDVFDKMEATCAYPDQHHLIPAMVATVVDISNKTTKELEYLLQHGTKG